MDDIDKAGLIGLFVLLLTGVFLIVIQTTSTTAISQVPCVDGHNHKIISPQNTLCEKQVSLLFGSEKLFNWSILSPVIILGIALILYIFYNWNKTRLGVEND